jgi:hypothetical protein|tara:strand:+ start:140 stop:430 length:291 start_codon:yes stop_codon:yes gene_type:complete
MKQETINKRLMKYKYFKEELIFIDDWNKDFISIQPTSQYIFYDYVNWNKMINILKFLEKNTNINLFWVGNYLFKRGEGSLKILKKNVRRNKDNGTM